ncbi:MAG: leucine-rich repeat protein [Clostridiales bacterium]|nr:leucine-rich repeat protein [Clostridiales bacterium]
MPKKFIAWALAVVMTSQMITPVISYGEDSGTGASAVNIADSALSDSSIVIDESTEITAEPTEIYSSSSSADTEEIISADFSEEGSCGDSVTYYYDSDTCTLTISGTGAMTDYSGYSSVPWYSLQSEITAVVIEEGVTTIGNCAFHGCASLTELTLPDSITSIGQESFGYCTGLTELTLPNEITNIGVCAFYSCTSLTEIILPNSLESIGNQAFQGCTKLKGITIPDGTVSIGERAFQNCTKLISITIPESVTTIGIYAFIGCSTFTTAGPIGGGYDYEFGWTETIPAYAFHCCSKITELTLPDSITSIGSYAFSDCTGLTSITLPNSLESIQTYAFCACESLQSITIPDSVTTLGSRAFHDCYALESVTLPNSITTINSYTFYYCTSLTDITIPDSVISINEGAFEGCKGLTDIVIPDSVTSLGGSIFRYCESLKSVTLPKGITSIPGQTFYDCYALESISIPDSVTIIDAAAFYYCSSLTGITIPDSVTTIGSETFYYCSSLTDITIPDSVISISSGAFLNCTGLTSVTLSENLTNLSENIFSGCISLTDVTIPESVMSISGSAFRSCESLTEITIPDSVTSFGTTVFRDCTALISVTLSENLTSLSDSVFRGCTGLTEITIPNSVTSIGSYAFYGCTGLVEIAIPDSVTSIGSRAFYDCTGLAAITIPDSVTSIGASAFYNCSNLTSITLPDSITSFGTGVFSGCENIVLYVYSGSSAEEYAIDNDLTYVIIIGSSITVNITDENGDTLSSDLYSINWYETGSDEIFSTGNTIYYVEDDKTYDYEIVLSGNASFEYYTPESGTLSPGETLTVTLKSVSQITISGSAADENGNVPSDLTVQAVQISNGYSKTITVETDENGAFSFEAANVTTVVNISADTYYTASKTAVSNSTDSETVDLGTIILQSLPENRITLYAYETAAAFEDTENVVTNNITSFDDINFTITNVSTGAAVSNFEVQYPYIIIGDSSVTGGSVIEIAAASEGRSTETVSITLDSAASGSGSIYFTENGKFYTDSITAINGMYAMVFDQSGSLVKRYIPASSNFVSDSMNDGTYTVVFLEKNSYLNNVSALSKLADYGLVEGTDYAEESVEISGGIISKISNVSVPVFDVSKLCYTVSDNTGVSINKNDIVTGNLALVRAEYEIDSKYSTSNESIIVEVPEGIDIVENNVFIDNKIASYTLSGGILTIPTNSASSAVVRFYISAYEAGEYDLDVSLSLACDGDNVTQPLGTARLTAEVLTMTVPKYTNSETITVGGKAVENSTVTVYDGSDVAGTTTANAAGSWQLSFDLINAYNHSNHLIYAKVDSYLSEITSQYYLTEYYKEYTGVSKVTMINTAHPSSSLKAVEYETIFDFKNPSQTAMSYRYYPSYPTFTFKIELDKTVSSDRNIVLYVYTSDGGAVELDAVYDSSSDCWFASGDFKTGALPVNVGVDADNYANDYIISCEDIGAMFNKYAYETEDDFTYAELVDSNQGLYVYGGEMFTFKSGCEYTDEISDEFDWFEVPLDNGEYIYAASESYDDGYFCAVAVKTEYAKEISGFAEIMNNTSSESTGEYAVFYEYASYNYEETEEIEEAALSSADLAVEEVYNTALAEEAIESGSAVIAELTDTIEISNADLADDDDDGSGAIQDGIDALGEAVDQLKDYAQDQLDDALGLAIRCLRIRANRVINNGGVQEVAGELAKTRLNNLEDKYQKANDTMDRVSNLAGLAGRVSNNCAVNTGLNRVSTLTDVMKLGVIPAGAAIVLKQADNDLRVAENSAGLSHSCGGDGDPEDYPGNDCGIIYDPSGYVYEAVPSNRIEGVTVSAYYLADDGEITFWDASEYDQTNPLTTDSGGTYAWDVPEGNWIVKFTKDGYYDTDSSNVEDAVEGWLPVPPPQTAVNVGIVSKSAPEIESINVFTTDAEITFSQYMQIDSVSTSNISFTINGTPVSGTITPMNAEYNYEGTVQYASMFLFTPDENMSGEVTVSVGEAVNYAGTAMDSYYTVTKTAIAKPQSIEAAETTEVTFNSGALIEVSVLPAEAGANKTLTAVSSSPSIVSVVNSTVTTDSEGKANIMVNGNLPGMGVITISLEGTSLSLSADAVVGEVADSSNKCAKVTASIASGTAVEKGTQVTLSTDTDGAVIYYTTNGTCPYYADAADKYTYTEPITIDEYTFIIAYAAKDGYENSNTAGFVYTVIGSDTTETTTEISTETSTEESTEASTETSTEESTEISTETSTETVSESTTETTTETRETSTETTTKASETSTETTTATTEATTETTTKTTSSSSSSGGGGGGSSSTCTIKFVPNNGVNSSTTYVRKNGTLTEPSTPVYDGYTFTGWYTDSDCTTLYDFSTKVTSSFTLYGGWKVSGEDESEDAETEAEEETKEEESQTETKESVIEKIVKVVIGSTVVAVETDGKESTYTMDTAPYIQSESSSTLVPLRFVAVAVYGDEVDDADSSDIVAWDSATKTASISVGNDTISFTAGSEYMSVNGKDVLMSNGVKAEITDGRMFIPFRALGEALGVEVDWDSTTKTAIYTAG